MMNYEMFKGIVETELSNFLDDEYKDMKVFIKPSHKINVIRDAVILRDTKKNTEFSISPMLFLDDMFRMYQQCESLPEVMNIIAGRIKEGMLVAPEVMKKVDFDNCKDKIIWQLINTDQNKALLSDCPHRDINDLSVIYRVVVDERDGLVMSSIITDPIAKVMGVNEQELFELASENTQRLYPVQIQNLNEMIKEMFTDQGVPEEAIDVMTEEIPENSCMYVITNSRQVNGAVSMLYIDKLDELAEKIGDDLYILPSSIHEVLAVSKSMGDPEMLEDMVYQVNTYQVPLEDRLSNCVYHYDRTAKTLTPATDNPIKSIDDKSTDKVAEKSMSYEAKPIRK